jgi:LysR family transcriptional regulator, glycine cleavage system transcriptional activator
MVRRHYNLPSLNALAAFEAAARHLSLTRAASELNVTPGAVSKQVKSLEEDIGRPLFVRMHRALQLTADGEAVFKSLREAFERMSQCLQSVSASSAARAVSIGTTMAVAQLWLMPRLGEFWKAHNDITVDHLISDRVHELQRNDIDLRIRYGDGAWQDEEAVKLFDDEIVPVASPGFAAAHRIKQPKDLIGLPLLSIEGVDWTWTGWADFFAEAGVTHRKLAVRRFNSYVIALQAAQDGQGVALGWMRLVQPLLASRSLVRLTSAHMKAPQAYYITWNTRRPLPSEAMVLRDWLLGAVA